MTQIWIRKPTQNDFGMVYNSWHQSYRKVGFNAYLPYDRYKAQQSKIITKILKGHTKTKIACLSDDPDLILGWVCYETIKIGATDLDIIHFIYVKHDYREQGIAKLLIEKLNCIVPGHEHGKPIKKIYGSHATPIYNKLKPKGYRCIYVPEIIEGVIENIQL